MNKIPIIVICGPTASGKTALSVELAKYLSGEIVSADSMQIYKYMDIGSAKPTMEERQGIAHHMMDIIEPTDNYSVADYCEIAHNIIYDISSRGKIPVMVGGTGLYVNSVVNDVEFLEDDGNHTIRDELIEFAKQNGSQALHKILEDTDPKAAEVIHKNNIRRVARAIEFIRTNGKLFSEHADEGKDKETRYRPLMFDIDWERNLLYERINLRVDEMFNQGLVDEVKRLLDMGVSIDTTAMQGIGYKETVSYLQGNITLDEVKEEIKKATRRYAKRQLTWFRRDDRIIHLNPDTAIEDAKKIAQEFLRRN